MSLDGHLGDLADEAEAVRMAQELASLHRAVIVTNEDGIELATILPDGFRKAASVSGPLLINGAA